ncbi:MAG: endonuclease III domain-containing protein [Elusimicrobia bacterium]|nr:endonuclease III domain-containing protein [Elusimicrobiota bacterium]
MEAGGGVRKTYSLLLAAFGPQGWWPVGWDTPRPFGQENKVSHPAYNLRRRQITPKERGKPLYRPGFYGRLSENEIFEICAGAILTQNTAWKNVEQALAALNAARITSPEKIYACPAGKLGRLIRSSGYYRQKAGRLRDFCAYVLRKHPEGLEKWFSASNCLALRAELLALKGIGPETADSMVLYAGGKPCFVIDAYTKRIARRLGIGGELSYEGWQELFQANLPANVKIYNEYHALLVKLGKDFCGKREPRCSGCPLRRMCNSTANNK